MEITCTWCQSRELGTLFTLRRTSTPTRKSASLQSRRKAQRRKMFRLMRRDEYKRILSSTRIDLSMGIDTNRSYFFTLSPESVRTLCPNEYPDLRNGIS